MLFYCKNKEIYTSNLNAFKKIMIIEIITPGVFCYNFPKPKSILCFHHTQTHTHIHTKIQSEQIINSIL